MIPKIRLGIVGYGNVARGVEYAVSQNSDMKLVAIFTRRNPIEITPQTDGVKVYHVSEAQEYIQAIDVMVLCGGSANDLPEQTPHFASMFNCVDSFDTHAKIPEHFSKVNEIAQKAKKICVISTGWDPGLFSLLRIMGMACIPNGCSNTLWGKGVSQGHSDAIRQIKGVQQAVQYTIPMDCVIADIRKGTPSTFSTTQKHSRECFVVAEPKADLALIEKTIKAMPYYFSDYETVVHFITKEEFEKEHSNMPHGGFVFRTGATGKEEEHHQKMEFSLQLGSNPEFTASVMVAYARAAYRLFLKGETGARTVFDIPIRDIIEISTEELRKTFL